MPFHSLLRRMILGLALGAVLLPILVTVLMGLAALLSAMSDTGGAHVVGRLALAAGILWLLDLICLTIAQALLALGGPPEDS